MAYKDILVYLDPTPSSDDRLRLAIGLAKAHAARLIAIDGSSDDAFLGAWAERAQQIEPSFSEAVKTARIEAEFVGGGDRQGTRHPDYLHCVDLMISPRPEGDARELVRPFVPDQALLNSGVPMLIIPQDWKFGPLGEDIVIAWNASREATRAVHDALPLLKTARKVTIFAFSSGHSGLRASSDSLAKHLLSHGVTAKVSDWTNTGDMTAVEALFADLDTQRSDLIVAGAFGHSRTFEGLFGGVSIDLMHQPSLPVLMSH
jgi:nucleotide-binding universal stress UspA family protein